jgi:hypothetical protein
MAGRRGGGDGRGEVDEVLVVAPCDLPLGQQISSTLSTAIMKGGRTWQSGTADRTRQTGNIIRSWALP